MRHIGLLLLLVSLWAHAGVDPYTFENKEYEVTYREVIDKLRCLVCQNQTIAGSNAKLALDLRQQVYEMVLTGSSKEEIYTFMVDRYGDFVLYEPRIKKSTLVLWIGPFVLLLLGVGTMMLVIRSRNRQNKENLSEVDLERVAKMLEQNKVKS